MASSFLSNGGGNSVRFLQQARACVNSSCSTGSNGLSNSSLNTITIKTRRRDRSLPFTSNCKSHSSKCNTNKEYIRSSNIPNKMRECPSRSMRILGSLGLSTETTIGRMNQNYCQLVRIMSTGRSQPITGAERSDIRSSQIFHNAYMNFDSCIAAALAATTTGAILFSSMWDDSSIQAEPAVANKTSSPTATVATSATISGNYLPHTMHNSDLITRNIYLAAASVLAEGVKETVEMIENNSGGTKKVEASKDGDTVKNEDMRPYFVSVRALRGGRLHMEDEYYVDKQGRFAAVFDGHGGNGVSAALRDKLYPKVNHFKRIQYEQELNEHGKNKNSSLSVVSWINVIRNAFDELDKDILMDETLCFQGSTAVAVYLHGGEDGERTIISANIGDSRAILSRRKNAVDLTRDHKPNEKEEKARIMKMGEEVLWDHHSKVYRVRGLSLSRALGDKGAKPAVSGEVEIKSFPLLSGDDEFVVLASDGLWDVMSSQEVVDFVHKTLKAPFKGKTDLMQLSNKDKIKLEKERRRKMGRSLASKAYTLGSLDNICVVIVWLNHLDDPADGIKKKV